MPPASPWLPLPFEWSPSADVLRETLDGGQAFRWHAQTGGTWCGHWGKHVVAISADSAARLQWRSLDPSAPTRSADVATYFATDRDWPRLADTLPWRSDAHLARCLAAFPGLRLLRQPFGETLLGFLCSATKQIPQIKQMLGLLATHHGDPTGDGAAALPTWSQLAEIDEAVLRTCQLGFRARYIKATALFLAAHPGWLEATEHAPYPEAKARLCSLPGVGEKVADCVLLFGAGQLEAFPVDTWIIKAMTRHYGLDGWTPAQVAHFGRQHFGPAAGFAQQFLFAWERAHGPR